jgi:hypothetical protein
MISQDGRVITARAARPCGHRPLLIARSYLHRVALRLVNQDAGNCHADAVGVISVSVTLPHPLGNRRLVQALNGWPIKYHVGYFWRRVRSSPLEHPRGSRQRAGHLRSDVFLAHAAVAVTA